MGDCMSGFSGAPVTAEDFKNQLQAMITQVKQLDSIGNWIGSGDKGCPRAARICRLCFQVLFLFFCIKFNHQRVDFWNSLYCILNEFIQLLLWLLNWILPVQQLSNLQSKWWQSAYMYRKHRNICCAILLLAITDWINAKLVCTNTAFRIGILSVDCPTAPHLLRAALDGSCIGLSQPLWVEGVSCHCN